MFTVLCAVTCRELLCSSCLSQFSQQICSRIIYLCMRKLLNLSLKCFASLQSCHFVALSSCEIQTPLCCITSVKHMDHATGRNALTPIFTRIHVVMFDGCETKSKKLDCAVDSHPTIIPAQVAVYSIIRHKVAYMSRCTARSVLSVRVYWDYLDVSRCTANWISARICTVACIR